MPVVSRCQGSPGAGAVSTVLGGGVSTPVPPGRLSGSTDSDQLPKWWLGSTAKMWPLIGSPTANFFAVPAVVDVDVDDGCGVVRYRPPGTGSPCTTTSPPNGHWRASVNPPVSAKCAPGRVRPVPDVAWLTGL